MISLLSQFKEMPWKNGRGITSQIDLFPQNAVFPDNFDWRVSSAKVQADDPFSLFANCERLLMVISGAGMTLNDHTLLPFQTYKFSGDIFIQSKLLAGPVVDLGVIYRPEKVHVQMSAHLISEAHSISLPSELCFIYCVSGAFEVSGVKALPGQCLKIEGELEVVATAFEQTRCVLISISSI